MLTLILVQFTLFPVLRIRSRKRWWKQALRNLFSLNYPFRYSLSIISIYLYIDEARFAYPLTCAKQGGLRRASRKRGLRDRSRISKTSRFDRTNSYRRTRASFSHCIPESCRLFVSLSR